MHYGAPLDFSGRAEDERSSRVLREVTETVRDAVQALSGQEYVDSYAAVKAGDESSDELAGHHRLPVAGSRRSCT